MNKFVAIFSIVCATIFSLETEKDLKKILQKTYLDTQADPFLKMMASQAISKTQKRIQPEELVALFREEVQKEENLKKLSDPYLKIFSNEEIHELSVMMESPVWKKFTQEGKDIFPVQMQAITGLFQGLANDYEAEIEVRKESAILQITKENFDELIASGKPILLDINAEWCGPCKMMDPILEDLYEEYQDQIQFGKVDFDSQKELAKEFGVTSLPTILFIKPGEKTATIKNIGFLAKEDFEEKIATFLESLEDKN